MKRPKVGLVLSGGGVRGFAHAGVIKALEKNGIPIDIITGASAGALIGGIYASGTSIETIFNNMHNLNNKRNFGRYILEPTFDGGFVKGNRLSKLIEKLLEKKKIQDFPIKFGCTTVDLLTGKVFNFLEGDAKTAIRSSVSVPTLLKPVKYRDMLLVDGGLKENIPIKLAKKMGAKVVIVSDVAGMEVVKKEKMSPFRVAIISILIMQNKLEKISLKENPDAILIKPEIDKKISILGFGNPKNTDLLIKSGEKATKAKISEIKDKISSLQ